MYINGFYIDGLPHKFNRNEDYLGIDILILTQKSDVVINILDDHKEMGNNGYVIWGTQWPNSINVLESEERINNYNHLDITPISKELLFFKNIQFDKYKDVLIINSLNKYMSNLNISYIMKQSFKESTVNNLQQVIIILPIDVYQDYKVNNSIKSNLGILSI